MAFDRLSVIFARGGLIAAALGLAACGRAGPLELPPGPATAQPAAAAAAAPVVPASTADASRARGPAAQETATKNGFDALGNPVAAPGEKKPFILDFLLQ